MDKFLTPKTMERRKYERYSTEVGIYYSVNYCLKTKIKYNVLKGSVISDKYPAVSKDVGAEGICFSSDNKLKKGDILNLEVYLPKDENTIYMTGEVRWSKPFGSKINTGVKLLTVSGKSVAETISYNEKYKIVWSIVLESIFGSFRKMVMKSRRKEKQNVRLLRSKKRKESLQS